MTKSFINEDFLLETDIAKELYHQVAKELPIIDYHNHLSPKEIAEDRQFENITQVWLEGDHYKWRAMRTFGIHEKFITGDASDKEKFLKWAETSPNTLRNPLFHWSQLELKRYFGIEGLLNPETAESIYEATSALLKTKGFSVLGLLSKMNVEVVCTTDDPLDDLAHHKKFAESSSKLKMLPTFRPDKAMNVSNAKAFREYVSKFEGISGREIQNLDSFMEAVQQRHNFFHEQGCRLSDHGLSVVDAEDFTSSDVELAFKKLLDSKSITPKEEKKLRSFIIVELGKMHHQKGWVQQFHLGPIRNNNSRLLNKIGEDAGCDSIGDYPQAEMLSKFLDSLDSSDQLAKTILYNVNPAQNEVFGTMAGNFNDGSVKGKVQWGSAWWFLDQLDGIEKQINTLSNVGLLSCFIGMLTDSRSFLSFPRHEYFRRLLCTILGNDVKKGHLPNDYNLLSKLVADVCYNNAKQYFNFSNGTEG